MLFTSPVFLFLFLPITFFGFLLARSLKHPALVPVWLLAASMIFYAWWSPIFLILLVGSTLVNWLCAHGITGTQGARSKAIFIGGLVWNLGLLAYFKYTDFFISSFNAVSGAHVPLLHIILPLGISFFTFQKIAYLADIHAGHAKPGRLLDFALFVFFFPQLIAGPIVHHAEVMPQFRAIASGEKSESVTDAFAAGLTLLLIGLAKKIGVADQVALLSTPVYEAAASGKTIGLILAWQAALAYTVQLYFDFSGYSDMAIGLARMFGVRMPANFDSPYKATSIIDFWRRWHMTLSRFLRDYLYLPLGGNRLGPMRRYLNLMIVMLLGGLWHGAGWTYVVWGGLHGFFLMIAHVWRDRFGRAVPKVVGWGLTMLGVIIAWVYFRAPDMATANNILGGMFGLHGVKSAIGLKEKAVTLLIPLALIVAAALFPNSQEIMRLTKPVLSPVREPDTRLDSWLVWQPSTLTAFLGAAILLGFLILSWKSSEFLYFQF